MKITLTVVGRTATGYLKQGIDEYVKRLSHYIGFDILCVGDAKNTKSLTEAQQKVAEGKSILATLDKSDYVVLLDEHGKEMRSMEFAAYIQKRMLGGTRRLVFVVGGPYGFSPDVYSRANDKISLSKMTLSHEMVRLVFTEQLYRAFTILNHEPYYFRFCLTSFKYCFIACSSLWSMMRCSRSSCDLILSSCRLVLGLKRISWSK